MRRPSPTRRRRIRRAGGLVAFPTETVYGLGANALDADAVERIFEAKGRPRWDPADRPRLVARHAGVWSPPRCRAGFDDARAERCLPGPLTVLVPSPPALPDIVTAGRPTVAVRMPAHPVALALIEQAGVPIAAPSANRFGHPSPTRADARARTTSTDASTWCSTAGPTRVGVESTVIDISVHARRCSCGPAASRGRRLEAVLGRVEVYRPPLVEVPRESLAVAGRRYPALRAARAAAARRLVRPRYPRRCLRCSRRACVSACCCPTGPSAAGASRPDGADVTMGPVGRLGRARARTLRRPACPRRGRCRCDRLPDARRARPRPDPARPADEGGATSWRPGLTAGIGCGRFTLAPPEDWHERLPARAEGR